MKVLVTGAGGQLGCALRATVPGGVTCVALGREELDITDSDAVERTLAMHRPDCLINAAAYTAVDRAEQEPERAFALNETAVAHLARAARGHGVRMVHVSTDYVFDGRSCHPYVPEDEPNPDNAYGRSKLAGERALAVELPAERYLIVRTSWLYALPGTNFVATMLRLFAERPEVRVVDDQIGAPTAAYGLAEALWYAVERNLCGVFHWCDAGVASWYDFAVAVREEAVALDLLDPLSAARILPIRSAEYPTPAKRPAFSVLDAGAMRQQLECAAVHWRVRLRDTLRAYRFTG